MTRRLLPSILLTSLLVAVGMGTATVAQEEEAPSSAPAPVQVDWERLEEARSVIDDATAHFGAQEWTEAARRFEAAAERLDGGEGLGGWRDQNLYNAACAHALAGRIEPALDRLEASLEHGFRRVPTRLDAARTLWQPGLVPSHVLADRDLLSLHDHPRWEAILGRWLARERLVVEEEPAAKGRVPAVLVLAATGATAEATLAPWRAALDGAHVRLAALEGPVRPSADRGGWLLTDGDERWGAAAVRRAIDQLVARGDVDPARVHLVAHDGAGGRVGWEAFLAEPGSVAGVAFPFAHFHAYHHADALARVTDRRGDRARARVVLSPHAERAAKLCRSAGLAVRTIEESQDPLEWTRRVAELLELLE